MLNKIATQLWNKCIAEIQKEETLRYIDEDILYPLFKRYYAKMQKIMLQIYMMYFIILLLIIIIIIILLFHK